MSFFFGEMFVYSTFCSHASMGTRDFVVIGWPTGSIHPVYASLQPHPTDVHVGHDNNNFSNEFFGTGKCMAYVRIGCVHMPAYDILFLPDRTDNSVAMHLAACTSQSILSSPQDKTCSHATKR